MVAHCLAGAFERGILEKLLFDLLPPRAGRSLVREATPRSPGHSKMASPLRSVMNEGPSGILAHAWEHDCDDRGVTIGHPVYEPSKASQADLGGRRGRHGLFG